MLRCKRQPHSRLQRRATAHAALASGAPLPACSCSPTPAIPLLRGPSWTNWTGVLMVGCALDAALDACSASLAQCGLLCVVWCLCCRSWYLTRLDLGRHAGYSCGFALEQLTRLRNLMLYEDSADVLLGSVGTLTSLTRLGLVDVSAGSIPKLKSLPRQLLELQLSLARLKRTEALPPGACKPRT